MRHLAPHACAQHRAVHHPALASLCARTAAHPYRHHRLRTEHCAAARSHSRSQVLVAAHTPAAVRRPPPHACAHIPPRPCSLHSNDAASAHHLWQHYPTLSAHTPPAPRARTAHTRTPSAHTLDALGCARIVCGRVRRVL
mmetsp:Transcript_22315/g.56788  ORF Transcript_22315/g.56788 Transcript_22315/m.56788 type:complete len:140 (+) Transcript_22315:354-773(+)